jgi:hypothetical protein
VWLTSSYGPAQVGGLRAVQNLLPQPPGELGGFPRMAELKVDVLDGCDVVIGGTVPSMAAEATITESASLAILQQQQQQQQGASAATDRAPL